jgi:hypothetical protein
MKEDSGKKRERERRGWLKIIGEEEEGGGDRERHGC